MPAQIIFEHPLNERIRIFLRLEHLFEQTGHFLPLQDTWANRAAVDGLLNIVHIFARSDLKTEILKELERHASTLGRIRRQPGVDMRTLGQVLDNLELATSQVYRLNGQIAQKLRKSEFLKSIMQRSSIPGGSCNFDLPQYHHWLSLPFAVRQQTMNDWLSELEPIRDAINLLLSLTRGSSDPTEEVAEQGFFQRVLDAQAPAQLIRVGVNTEASIFAEISGNKHRFSIRFLDAVDTERPSQTQQDIEFTLTCCVI